MTHVDDLPADQRAVLSILLVQGRSYEEVASLLRIDEDAVRERARTALRSLAAAPGPEPTPAEIADLADYLLAQQGAAARAATRALLGRSAPARSWARRVAAALAGLPGAEVPEVPAEPEDVAQAFQALDERTSAREAEHRLSRRLTVVIAVATALAVAAIIVLIVHPDGSTGSSSDGAGAGSAAAPSDSSGSSASPTTPTSSTTPATGTGTSTSAGTGAATSTRSSAHVIADVNLNPSNPGSPAHGLIQVLQSGSTVALSLTAQDLPASTGFTYVLWLYNSPTSAEALGMAPAVGPSGRIGPVYQVLPDNAHTFHELILTRETSSSPSRPGPIVLAGDLSAVP